MKLQRIVYVLAVITLLLSARAYSQDVKPNASSSSPSADSFEAFLGRWDLTLKGPDREYPSWLELRQEGGQLKAQMVSRWGNTRPLPKVSLSNGHLTFVSPKEEEERRDDMVFEGTLVGKMLSGTTTGPDGTPWRWTGERAPVLKARSTPKWGKPISLFNGKDLTGWKMQGTGTTVWKVEDGNLVSPGNGPELINDSKFEDFKLHVEFNCGANSNSGVYLRGRYEVQIETDSIEEPPSHHMGGVYGFSKFRSKPTPSRNHRVTTWAAYTVSWRLRRNCPASRENGRASISRWSGVGSPSFKMARPSSITKKSQASRAAPWTATKNCRDPFIFREVKKGT